MKLPGLDDFKEVTRLTREGRLQDAMALLKDTASAARTAVRNHTASTASDANRPASVGGFKGAGSRSNPGRMPQPSSFRGVLDSMGQFAPAVRTGGLAGGSVSVPVPAGARYEEHAFTGPAGSRTYKLYVPSSFSGQPLPLVIMLHGCTQSPDDFALGTRMNELAEELQFLVAYPAQPKSANSSKCWNWFRPIDQQRDRGEPSLIAGLTRQIMQDFPVARGRVYIAGLSAGGAAAAIMGQTYPDLYAAVGVHSGLACGVATDVASAFAAMQQGGPPLLRSDGRAVPTIVFHGDHDKTVHPLNGEQVIAQAGSGAALERRTTGATAPGGICYTRTVQADRTGHPVLESWVLHGVGHAWSGGSPAGSYTEPRGPDASREMMRFFGQQSGLA